MLAVAPPMLLGGMLPLDPSWMRCWPFATAWVYPVGDPMRLGAGPRGDEPAFQVTRGVTPGGHEGADLSNRRGGDPVRAAAGGLVVVTGERSQDGFGVRVVLAHREADARVVYSVYSHLAAGSVAVAPGDVVALGQDLGRVGMTGRATSPHLHFEVRVPERLDERWEKAPVVDPVAFVDARLPAVAADSGWARELVTWGESTGLVAPGLAPDALMPRSEWWCALAVASGVTGDTLTRDAFEAAQRIGAIGLIDLRHAGAGEGSPGWAEVAHDLGRLRLAPRRLPPAPMSPARLEAVYRDRFDVEDAGEPAGLGRLERGPATRAEVVLLLAACATPRPEPRHHGAGAPPPDPAPGP